MKVDERLKSAKESDLVLWQERLNKLCDEQGLKKWSLQAGSAEWKELCLRIIGVPAISRKKKGRKKHPEEYVDEIGMACDTYNDFSCIDDKGNEIPFKPLQKKQIYAVVAKLKGITGKADQHGVTSRPENKVKGLWDRYRKQVAKYRDEYNESDDLNFR